MDVYVKETLYVIDYNNDIPNAALNNMIFVSDDHMTPGYAYDITIKEANTGYSDLTFSIPNTIIDDKGNQVHNPKLDLLVPLVKLRYHREVYYTGEKEILVREPEGYGETTIYKDRVYKPHYPDNVIEDYIMDYVVQPIDKKRNTLEIATTFTAIDYPRFTLSKKKVGLLIDEETITRPEWSIVNPGEPMDRPGMIKYIPWSEDLSKKVLNREDYKSEEEYNAACLAMCQWNPMTTTQYPLNKEEVEKLKSDQSEWPYGFEATCFYWPIVETGRYQGILYEEGGWIGFQGYDLLGLQVAGLDPELHTTDVAWHWTQIYAMKDYLTPNNAANYLHYILDGTVWEVAKRKVKKEIDGEIVEVEEDDVDSRMVPVYNPSTGVKEGETEYTAYLSLNGSNCYNAITTLCQNFQLYPVFDCLNRKVSLRIASGKNYGLTYRLGDNIKTDSKKWDGEKVITKLYVSGGSDNIGSANINIGTATREYLQNLQGFYSYYDPDEDPKQDGNLAKAEVKGKWAVVDSELTNFNTTTYELDYNTEEIITIDETVEVMPEPSQSLVNKVYKYIGKTNDDYTRNFAYKCILKDDGVTYGWLDVTGEPYLKEVTVVTHGLDTPEYWNAGENRKVYYRNNGTWEEATRLDSGNWSFTIDGVDYVIDPISGMEAPWDPNDDMYIMSRSPYWTNFIMNLRWHYANGWITKEQILELYQYNLQINNLNKSFGDKYIEDRRATQTAYENAKNNYDIAQDGYESTLFVTMPNKYYWDDGDFTEGYTYCFHTAPKDVFKDTDEQGKEKSFIKLFHCYDCGHTEGVPCKDNGDQGDDITSCPECGKDTDIVNNKIWIQLYDDYKDKFKYDPTDYPYGTDVTYLYINNNIGGYKYNPQLKGYFLRLVIALDKMDAREEDYWGVEDYEKKISLITPIEPKRYVPPTEKEKLFDNYNYVIPEFVDGQKIRDVWVRSTSGQIEVWNEAIETYIRFYGQMLDNKRILDAAIKHIEQLEEVYESWDTIVNGLFEQIQANFSDFIIEGNYQNTDQPSVAILFNEGIDASDKYSIPEITYDLDVVDASGLVEYRRPNVNRYECKNCHYISYREPTDVCVNCGLPVDYVLLEDDIYNDLVRKLHSVGQIVPKAGDYVDIYDLPMGLNQVAGLITEVTRYPDEPIKNSIRIDTSYTDADQLVGNIINATNTILSNKDIYARTAILNGDGTIDPDSIKDTLNTSGADISIVSTNGSILLNGNGLRCIDPGNSHNAIKYTGTGIFKTTNLDNENGENEAVIWERMMTPEGINATYISSGTIDTNKLNITAGSGSKVIIDKFGLYVKKSTAASAHIEDFDETRAKSEPGYTELWGDRNNIASFVGIDNNNDPLIYTRGFLVANAGSNIANWITSNEGFYHLNGSGQPDLWLSPTGSKPLTPEGESDTATVNNHDDHYVLYANGNFGVNAQGKLYATDAVIEGDITVTGGDIGGFHVTNTQMYGPKAGLSGDNTDDYICPNCGYTSKDTFSTCPECEQTVTPEVTPRKWAFWAGKDEAHKDDAPFKVDFDGNLYASAGKIGGWKIESDKLSGSGTISGGTVSGSAIKSSNISGGSISISQNNGSYYFNMGVTTNHPNASGLNVGWGGVNINSLGITSDGSTFTLAGGIKTPYATIDHDLVVDGDATVYGTFKTNKIAPGGALDIQAGPRITINPQNGPLNLLSGGTTGTASNSGILIRAGAGHVTIDASNNGKNTSYYAYVRGGSEGTARIAKSSSGPSSRCLKTNIVDYTNEEYQEALELLNDIEIYNYQYKYNIHEKQDQYGFMIDDLLDNDLAKKFLYFRDEKALIDENNALNYLIENPEDEEKAIKFKRYDEETLIKYLLVCCKALQQEIEEIKKEKTN